MPKGKNPKGDDPKGNNDDGTKGANIDAKDFSGQTPLHKASNIAPIGFTERNFFPYAYRKSTVEQLLKLGATPVMDSVAQLSDAGAATAKAPAADQ